MLPETVDEDGDAVTVTLENSAAPWLTLSEDQKRLEVAALATYGLEFVKTYDVTLTLEDDSAYGRPRTQSFTF